MNEKEGAELSRKDLLQKAANASSEGITISTMSEPDRPLIFVNQGFEDLTGYSREEVLGKNCRFLQGVKTDQEAVDQIRNAIKNEEACTVELLNYRKDGSPFWNRLSITPIFDNYSNVSHYVGIQSDITSFKLTEKRLKTANDDLRSFQDRILQDLEQARMAQRFLLPAELPCSDKVCFASLFTPMEKVGGDFYDVLNLGNNNYGILIADVTGHGIPAALLTFMSSTTFKNAASGHTSPAKTLELVNERLYQKMPGDAFVTMFYCIYNTDTNKLTYAQAGHPDGYIIRSSTKEILSLTTNGALIGVFPNEAVVFEEQEITLVPGDRLIVYTDAISDAIDNSVECNEVAKLTDFFKENFNTPLQDLFNSLFDHGLKCANLKTYSDDFTLLGMEVVA